MTLELADDAADIFEVRGYPRTGVRSCPIAARDDAATFQYDGLDSHRTRTHVAFSEPGDLDAVDPTTPSDLGGAVRYRWGWPLAAGAAHELSWIVWSSDVPSSSGDGTDDGGSLFPEPPRIAEDEGAAAYHAWTRSTTAVSTDNELFNLTIN